MCVTNTFETWHSLTVNAWCTYCVLKCRKVFNVITCLFKGSLQGIWKPSEEWKTFLHTGEWPHPWPWWQNAWQQMCPVCWNFVSGHVFYLEWLRRWSGDRLEWWVKTALRWRIVTQNFGNSFTFSINHNTT